MPPPSRRKKHLTYPVRRRNIAAGATIKHFAVCNGVNVELLNPWYSDLKRDFERLIGRPHLDGEKLVRNCQLFAFGYARPAATTTLHSASSNMPNTLASTNAALGAEQPRERTVSALAAELITDQPPNRAHKLPNDGSKGTNLFGFSPCPLFPLLAASLAATPQRP